MYVYIRTYVHTYIGLRTHTYIHTHTHTIEHECKLNGLPHGSLRFPSESILIYNLQTRMFYSYKNDSEDVDQHIRSISAYGRVSLNITITSAELGA